LKQRELKGDKSHTKLQFCFVSYRVFLPLTVHNIKSFNQSRLQKCIRVCITFYLRFPEDGALAPKHVGVLKLSYTLWSYCGRLLEKIDWL